jgi:hypothetical protein
MMCYVFFILYLLKNLKQHNLRSWKRHSKGNIYSLDCFNI